jgi:hypothetical protein
MVETQLDEISSATENISDPDKRNEALYDTYLAAKETAKNAPAAVTAAEAAYFTAIEGSDGYATRLHTQLQTEAVQVKTRLVAARVTDTARITAALETYKTTAHYAANIDGVVLAQLNDVIAMADAVDAGKDAQVTNDRKSTFLNTERSTVATWDSYLTIALWVLSAVYAKSNLLPELKNPLPWVMFALIATSPWLLGIVGWVVGRRIPPFNAYTTFSA